jgi:superfamily II DNA/RNA helicase
VTHNLQTLVIDEADELLKIGFEEDLTEILKLLGKDH